jgi:hypothetical protein
MADEIWDIDRIAREIGGTFSPVTPASARKEMARAKIKAIRGYPAQLVRDYLSTRKGQGHRTDLEES